MLSHPSTSQKPNEQGEPEAPAKLPSLRRTLAVSLLCSIGGGLAALVIGYFVGHFVYPYFTSYFNNTIYSSGAFGTGFSKKVQIQAAIHMALTFGTFTFWTAFLLPWLRYVILRYRHRSS